MIMKVIPEFDSRFLTKKEFITYYCKSSTAMEYILEKKQLRFSSLVETNDPIEAIKKDMVFIREIQKSLGNNNKYKELTSNLKWSIMNTKIACFCQNRKHNPRKDELVFNKGYPKPRMWAQYGEDQKGICIIFNKIKLIQKCRKYRENNKVYSLQLVKGSIYYTNAIIRLQNIFTIMDADLVLTEKQFIQRKERYLFRTKFLDFKDEHEYRIAFIPHKNTDESVIGVLPDLYIDISECIEGIICGSKFNKVYHKIIIDYAKLFNVNAYQLSFKKGYPSFEKLNIT